MRTRVIGLPVGAVAGALPTPHRRPAPAERPAGPTPSFAAPHNGRPLPHAPPGSWVILGWAERPISRRGGALGSGRHGGAVRWLPTRSGRSRHRLRLGGRRILPPQVGVD